MYRPDHFRLDDPTRALEIVRAHPLATLVVLDENGAPQATPVPVVADTHDGGVRLRFHLARANPLCDALATNGSCLLSFVGAEGYVSPDWYGESKHLPPTWNYESVQARGATREVSGDALRALVADLAALEEARLAPKPVWTDAKMGEDRVRGMLRAIRGFEIAPVRLEAKAKLSQNRAEADRDGVVTALDELGSDGARALAAAMRRANAADDA